MNPEIIALLKKFGSRETGLSEAEANKLYFEHGPNTIEKKAGFSIIKMIGHQFSDFLVIILLVAGSLALAFSSFRDAGIMYAIVVINASIGFFQEFKIEKTLRALAGYLPKKARVIRNRSEKEILSEYVVPGDIIVLSAGEDIPADAIIIEAYGLKTDESTLTGESHPVSKFQFKNDIKDENQLFMGTTILEGSAKAVVEKISFGTEFGKIARATTKIKEDFSPLQKKLNKMSH